MAEFRADLHVHTCLSPCADEAMTPAGIVRQAKQEGLDLVAVCDHNSAENVPAARRAGAREGVAVIGGMEVTTREEIHILGLFGDNDALMKMQDLVYDHLAGKNNPERFGTQTVMDENDRAVALNERLLIGATDLPLERVVDAIHAFGGVAIASHLDRPSFSITSQLGFIPPGLALDGVETGSVAGGSHVGGVDPGRLPVLTSSDAHFLADIGKAFSVLRVGEASFQDLAKALKGTGGCSVRQR